MIYIIFIRNTRPKQQHWPMLRWRCVKKLGRSGAINEGRKSTRKLVRRIQSIGGSLKCLTLQTESKKNLIEFYKQSHTRKLDGKLINEVAEATYVDSKVAKQVFHEVLGHKSGHVRGLENSAIPKPSPTSRSSHVTYLTEQVK
ncbi:hypothetical protein CJ030_MR6G024209 [Morella rubra]|uniref:Uncharacterized protein n=1 Tax=Morella rubra TaxID=262757 RepID=A0A6A1VC10_9ROSI|nr:hypothetical protein CJ030_MR6G024209 [Morella rubra]